MVNKVVVLILEKGSAKPGVKDCLNSKEDKTKKLKQSI